MSEIVESKITVEFDENRKYRYSWKISYGNCNERTNDLLVIMMNPSKANESGPDRTISKILKWNEDKLFCEDKSFDSVMVMNISPLVETNSNEALMELEKINFQYIKRNFSQLADAVDNVNNIIIAWGNIGDKMFRRLLKKYQEKCEVKCFVSKLQKKVCSKEVKYLEKNSVPGAFRHPRRAWEKQNQECSLQIVNKDDFPVLFADYK